MKVIQTIYRILFSQKIRWNYFTIFSVVVGWCIPVQGTTREEEKQWTLRACVEYAREYNLQVKYAEIARENSCMDLTKAKAQQIPSLNFSSVQGRGHQKQVQMGGGTTSATAYTGSYTLNGSWTIYGGSKIMRTIRQQELVEQVQFQEVLVAQNDIEIAVTKAYLQVLYANETLKTNRQTQESSLVQLERSRELRKAGSIRKSDLAQMESQYSSDCYKTIQSENDLALSRLQLKQLLELEPEDSFEVFFPEIDEKMVLSVIPSLEKVFHAALLHMPEMESRKLGVEAALLGERVAKGDHLPSVTLEASMSTNHDSKASDAYSAQLKDRLSENVGINISIPISNRKQARVNVSKAKLQIDQARLDEINERKNLLQTVETLHQDVIAAQGRYSAAVIRVKAAYESYQLVQQEFEAGLKNAVDLLVEKNNYLSALQEEIQAKYQAVLAMKLLNFYQNEPIDF